MIQHNQLEHKFVNHLPEVLEPSILYVSMEFGTAAHHCCCGCGEEIITPLTPTDWQLNYNGESISLNPSIGNWDLKCRSHYVIRRGRVIEAGSWSDEQIVTERTRDKKAKSQFYKTETTVARGIQIIRPAPDQPNINWWDRLKLNIRNWF